MNYIEALEQLIAAGEIEFESMNALKDRIKELTGKRPGGSFQRNQADYKRLLSYFTFKKFVEKAPKTDLSKFTLTKSLAKKVKDVNALHKGVYFQVEKSTNGHPYLRVRFNPSIKLTNIDKMGDIGPPTEKTFNNFSKIINKVVSTPEYIKYNKPTLERADINRIKRQAERARKIADPTDIYKSIQQLKLQISKDMGFGPIASEVHVHHGAIKTAKTNLNNMAFIFGKELNNADDIKALEVELAKLNNASNRLLKNKPEGYKELIKEQNLAKNIAINKYRNTPIAGLNEATQIFFDKNDNPIRRRIKMDVETTIGRGSKVGEIDFKTVTPKQRTKILDVAGENFTKQLIAYVSTLDKKSPEFKQICTLTAASGGTAASCIERINQQPVKVAENIIKTKDPVGKLGAFKNSATNFLKLLGRGGLKAAPLAAAAAVGAGIEPLVKQFVSDDPNTYLTNENQMKGMLLATLEGEPPQVDEEILKWQLPSLAGATAAGTIPGAKTAYLERRGVGPTGPLPEGVGKTRAALGIKGVLGKALGASFSPLAVAATAPFQIAAQREGGTEWGDIATDPMNWMGPAFASSGAEMASKGIKNPMLLKALRMGMSPRTLRLVASRFGLPGLAVSAGMWGYDKWKNRSINDED